MHKNIIKFAGNGKGGVKSVLLSAALLAGFFAVQSAGAFGAHVYIQSGEHDRLFTRFSRAGYRDAQNKAMADCNAYKAANSANFSGGTCTAGRWFIGSEGCHAIAVGNRPGREGDIAYTSADRRTDKNAALVSACDNAGRYLFFQTPDPPLSGPRSGKCNDFDASAVSIACYVHPCFSDERLDDSHASESHHRCVCKDGLEKVGDRCLEECTSEQFRDSVTNECGTCEAWQRMDNTARMCVNCPAGQEQNPDVPTGCRNCPSGKIRPAEDSAFACRDRKPADCGSMIFSSGTKTCRPAVAGDCSDSRKYPRVVDGVLDCTSCNADQVKKEDGLGCRRRAAPDCGSLLFVFGPRTCRPVEANDCPDPGEYPIAVNGNKQCIPCDDDEVEADNGLGCEEREAADCGGMIFESGTKTCRPAESGDCPDSRKYPRVVDGVSTCTECAANEEKADDGLSCRERVARDCGSSVFVSDTKSCRPAEAGDCADPTDFRKYPVVADGEITCTPCPDGTVKADDGLSCRPRVAADCMGRVFLPMLKLCRDAARNDCPDSREYPRVVDGVFICTPCAADEVKASDGLSCQDRGVASCGTMVFVSNTKTCRPAEAGDCRNPREYPVVADGVATCTACAAGEVKAANGLSCQERVAADCGAMVFVSNTKTCRPVEADDCGGNGDNMIPNGASNGVANCQACPANMPVENSDGLTCRAAGCSNEMPVMDDDGGCRARRQEDCDGIPATPVLGDNGECRVRVASDCSAGMVFDSGECRPPQKDDCRANNEIPNPQNGGANCTACGSGEIEHADGLRCVAETGGGGGGGDCAAPRISDGAGGCMCPAGMEDNPATSDANDCRAVCAAGMVRGDNGNCMCPDGEINVGGACQTSVDCAADGPAGSERNNATNECECPADKPALYTAGEESHCVASLPGAGRYTARECESAGWRFATAVNNSLIREICGIPVRVELSFAPPESSGVRAQAVVNPADGAEYPACILRGHENFGGADLPECEDAMLFGASGLPQKPAGFDAAGASARITVATAGIFYNNAAVQRFTFSSGGGGGGNKPAQAVGYTTAAGLLLFIGSLIYDNIEEGGGFSWTPDYAFSSNGGVAAYSYGSRLDYQNGGYSAYWTAGRRHTGAKTGEWNYAAGAKYGRDFWKISYGSRIFGENTDIELSAALSEKTGVFGYSSGMIWDYRTDGTDGATSAFWRNSMTAELDGWRLTPSAAFVWRGGGNFRIDLRREF